MFLHKYRISLILIALIFVETLCYSYLAQTRLYYTTSILYFLSGIGICFLPLLLKLSAYTDTRSVRQMQTGLLVISLFFIIILGILLFSLPQHLKIIPIDYHIADMLPRIKIYVLRFLHGNYVYDPVKEIWNGNLPPYLPAVWMPFIPAIIWGYDMRWTAIAAFLICVLLILKLVKWSADVINNLLNLLLLAGLFLLINFHAYHDTEVWTMSYEGLISLYYVILCLAIIGWNPYILGLAISLCLLSRFSLSFWVPVFLIFLWWYESFWFALKVGAVMGGIIICGLLIPFVVGHLDIFLNTINQYKAATKGCWTAFKIDEGLYREVGLYKFFSFAHIDILERVQFISTLIAPLFFIVLIVKCSSLFKGNKQLIGLCSLKFTLLLFFNFIEMPFHYIFMTPTIISYAIGFYFLSLKEEYPASLVMVKK